MNGRLPGCMERWREIREILAAGRIIGRKHLIKSSEYSVATVNLRLRRKVEKRWL